MNLACYTDTLKQMIVMLNVCMRVTTGLVLHIQKAELCSNGTLHTNCLQHYYILTIMVYCDCNFGMSLPIKFHRGKAKWLFEKMFSKNLFTTRSV